MKTTIAGTTLHLTEHAVQRYIERIKHVPDPTHTERTRFAREFATLVQSHGVLVAVKPEWINDVPEDAEHVRRATHYVCIGADLAIPVANVSNGMVGYTFLARGGYSPGRRADRNARRQEQRQRRRARRLDESWRGEKAPRWK